MLAFAAGDALGWPQEMKASGGAGAPSTGLRTWLRRTGGRFQPHHEIIRAGEYSDDTQATLAVARALRSSPDWWECLTRRELPLLTLYERGAGAAMLRACGAWRRGVAPWEVPDASHRRAYFNAGANGVAMRVLPHVLRHATDLSPALLVQEVFLDGMATHGHARALLGASLYAAAAHRLLRSEATLGYGELIERLVAGHEGWAVPPIDVPAGWLRAQAALEGESFAAQWKATTDEILHLLQVALEGLRQGALADDYATLDALGCFGKTKGSGVITAVAAIYLASRHAAQPIVGVTTAAFAVGADTDTLAAMTGGLLGALAGTAWMPVEWLLVQDANVIERVADRLLCYRDEGQPWRALSDGDLRDLRARLMGTEYGEVSIDGPLNATVTGASVATFNDRPAAEIRSATLSDGQTIYVKHIIRKEPAGLPTARAEVRPEAATFLTVRLLVRDLVRTASFYGEVLGLRVLNAGAGWVSYGPIELRAIDPHSSPGMREVATLTPHIVLSVASVDDALERLVRHGERVLDRAGDAAEDAWCICRDPEGHTVELVQHHPAAPDTNATRRGAPRRNRR